ncbi:MULTISPECIES: hypothetical protein [unclassified Imperialibacter]|uniref:hypothetical protein n=1 Tax=unclassified Imperialibacter TaxID=2629706 RepID=UPI00125B7EE0|nr:MULTISPECIES: hypothetical protein [unclassified Imperialibacter]CAD5267316.1 membrane hypothetical protein [Imperialibacter sp. 89]CAD5295702.1 membrane hypothetical protein [Imperialibacter sp. 75]VVT33583.1 membrane hypothetical protein [Imperialibacter sp. EC-SDR9]
MKSKKPIVGFICLITLGLGVLITALRRKHIEVTFNDAIGILDYGPSLLRPITVVTMVWLFRTGKDSQKQKKDVYGVGIMLVVFELLSVFFSYFGVFDTRDLIATVLGSVATYGLYKWIFESDKQINGV